MNKTIYAILPCYNEEENISELINLWNNEREKLLLSGYNLIITPVNDASTDTTRSILLNHKEDCDNVFPLLHKKKYGVGLCS